MLSHQLEFRPAEVVVHLASSLNFAKPSKLLR